MGSPISVPSLAEASLRALWLHSSSVGCSAPGVSVWSRAPLGSAIISVQMCPISTRTVLQVHQKGTLEKKKKWLLDFIMKSLPSLLASL
ncbi:uncharacterized protein ACOB8E_013051 isoform 2-T2 [Sarcophilus harrisii]